MPFVLPVDGSWSPWSIITGYFLLNRSLSILISLDLLGPCSLECGGGDQRTYRSCTDPAPRVRATRVWDKGRYKKYPQKKQVTKMKDGQIGSTMERIGETVADFDSCKCPSVK